MKRKTLIGFLLAFGITAGAIFSPLFAQQDTTVSQRATCHVGENSGAACSGKGIVFAGNTSGVDSGAWVVRMNSETGEIWYKNGKKLVLLEEPE